jgi:hypothetical protein
VVSTRFELSPNTLVAQSVDICTIGSDFLYFVVEILKEQKARKPLINKEKPST